MIAPGLLLAVGLALLSLAVAQAFGAGLGGLPKIPVSAVLCAVIVGMLWRNLLGVPRWSQSGLHFAMQPVLRAGIALVGLRLTLAGAGAIAATALPIVVVCIAVALVAGYAIARLLRVSPRLGTLIAAGTAVCGCTAVIVLAPVIRARNDETAFAVTCVVLFGCIGMLCYPLLAASLLDASPIHAGIFLGTAIHDTSQVIGSALIYSQQAGAPDSLAAASVTKLLRNVSIALLVPAAALMYRNERGVGAREAAPGTAIVPLFVIAFIVLVLVRTAGDALLASNSTWAAVVELSHKVSDLLLTCGMAAVGLSVSFAQMWRIGWRPLVAGLILAALVAGCSLSLVLTAHRWGF